MSIQLFYAPLLVLLNLAIAYRVLPILQNNFKQGKIHNNGNRLPGLLFVLLLMPVFIWAPLTIADTGLRGGSAFILLWVCPAKLLSIAWDSPIDNLPPGFLYFAIACIVPARIRGRAPSRQKSTRSFRTSSKKSSSNGHSRSFSDNERSNELSECFQEPSRSSSETSRSFVCRRFPLRLLQTVIIIAIANCAYFLRDKVHIWFIYGLYCGYIYLSMEIGWDFLAKSADLIAGLQTDPCFVRPFMATSLTEFWGQRWNLVANAILRATIYDPIVNAFGNPKKSGETLNLKQSEKQWRPSTQNGNPKLDKSLQGRAVGTMASFLVSGLVHEALFCYINLSTQVTWKVTWFFILNGLATVGTVYVEKHVGSFKLPKMIRRVLTLGFLYVTVAWLFMPELTRSEFDLRALEKLHSLESSALRLFAQVLHLQ